MYRYGSSPPAPPSYPLDSPNPSSATAKSNAAVRVQLGPASADAEPRSEAPSAEDLASWENPDLGDLFAPALPPEPEQSRAPDSLEGRSIGVDDDDGSEVSTLTGTGDGIISLNSSVLNPWKRVLPVIAKPVDEDEDYPRESAGGIFGWWRDLPRWIKVFSVAVVVVLVAVLAVVGVSVGTGAFIGDSRSAPGSQSAPPPSFTATPRPSAPPSAILEPTEAPNNSLGGGPVISTQRPTSSTPSPTTEEVISTQRPTSSTPSPTTEEPATPAPQPTLDSTLSPTQEPTPSPTDAPQPTAPQPTITKFYVMGSRPADDVFTQPTDDSLSNALSQISSDFDWVIHLGDFSNGSCSIETNEDFDLVTASQSTVPVFMLPGENEWNNCPEPDQAWSDWTSVFSDYNTKHWPDPNGYSVARQSSSAAHVEENFAFPFRGVLHVGVNLVGGTVQNESEWDDRLAANLEWITQSVFAYRDTVKVALIYCNNGPENQDERLDVWYQTLQQLVQASALSTIVIYESDTVETSVISSDGFYNVLKFKGGFWPPLAVNVDTGLSGNSWDLDFTWL